MYNAKMDEVDDAIFKNSLSIIIDTAVVKLVSDNRYTLSKGGNGN